MGTDTTLINCPRSFAHGGVSAAFHRFRSHGLRTPIATDGYVLDIVSELNAAGLVSKLATGDSGVAPA